MRDDLIELYPERELDEHRLAELRSKLFAAPKPRRRWTGAAAVAAAVVLVVAGIGLFVRWPDPTIGPAASLTEAADRLEATADPSPYLHVTRTIWQSNTVELANGRWYAYAEEFVAEVWVPASGQVRESRRVTGEVRWLGGTEPESVLAARPQPELPQEWRQRCATAPCWTGDDQTDADRFTKSVRDNPALDPHSRLATVLEKLESPFTPKRVQTDLYRTLALVPEVRFAGDRVFLSSYIDGGRLQLKIDPVTGRYAGYEQIVGTPSRLPAGTVLRSVDVKVDDKPPA